MIDNMDGKRQKEDRQLQVKHLKHYYITIWFTKSNIHSSLFINNKLRDERLTLKTLTTIWYCTNIHYSVTNSVMNVVGNLVYPIN